MSFETLQQEERRLKDEKKKKEATEKMQKRTLVDVVKKNKVELAEEKRVATQSAPEHAAAKKGMDLKSIIHDKEKGELFKKFLQKNKLKLEDENGAFARLLAKKLQPGDIEKLENIRSDFVELYERAEKTGKFITPEMTTELGTLNTDFQQVINQLSPEKAVKVYRQQLKEMAISNTDDFDYFERIERNVEAIARINTERDYLEKKINEYCIANKISSEAYQKIIAIEESDERNEALIDFVRKNWGEGTLKSLARGIDTIFFKLFSRVGTRKIGGDLTRDEILKSLANIQEYKKKIAQTMAESVEGLESFRIAYAQAILDESEPESEPRTSLIQHRKKFIENMPNENEILKDWQEYKTSLDEDLKMSFDEMDNHDKENAKKEFLKHEKKKYKNKIKRTEGGFLYSIFKLFFNSLFTIDVSKLN